MYQDYGLLIGGEWRKRGGAGEIEVADPATGEVIGASPAASVTDVEDAIAAAEQGLKIWRAAPAWTRADVLHKTADIMMARTDEAARRMVLETGKPLAQARREWGLSIDQFRWYAEEARRIYGRIIESRAPGGRVEISHEPIGIAAAFTAWNFSRTEASFLSPRETVPYMMALWRSRVFPNAGAARAAVPARRKWRRFTRFIISVKMVA